MGSYCFGTLFGTSAVVLHLDGDIGRSAAKVRQDKVLLEAAATAASIALSEEPILRKLGRADLAGSPGEGTAGISNGILDIHGPLSHDRLVGGHTDCHLLAESYASITGPGSSPRQ